MDHPEGSEREPKPTSARLAEGESVTPSNLAKRELALVVPAQQDEALSAQATVLEGELGLRQQRNQAESERLGKLAAELSADLITLEAQKHQLSLREKAIILAEQRRDAGFAAERDDLQADLRIERARMEATIEDVRRAKLAALEDEITTLKGKRLEDVARAEASEHERLRGAMNSERLAWTTLQEEAREQLQTERTELERQKGALSAALSECEGLKAELESNERTLHSKDTRLERQWQKRSDDLEASVDAWFAERRAAQDLAEAASREERTRLCASLRSQTELLGAFEQLQRQLGGKDPAEIIRTLNSQTDELSHLREDLATRPPQEMRERYKLLETEAMEQRARVGELGKQVSSDRRAVEEVAGLRLKNAELEAEKTSFKHLSEIYEGAANEAVAELKRLHAAYDRPTEVAARYGEIELPHLRADQCKPPVEADIDEMTWLTGVGNACNAYGMHFNPRILKAFHTALKTSEWSPLTILAGVSGTGKSELPRMYSHFGGLFFEPLSVQPNWDAQESMLGFFNSIDNKFDAQPVLRFLAQTQKDWLAETEERKGYPGLSTAVCLVHLDELNLAHPELYFAEFLSKLELRRGMKGTDVPFLPVKIGAGLPPYKLPLGRNVLWTGTMNQDETTKSLSDKVIDRSIIIHFPRPTELKRRLQLTPLDGKNRGPALHINSWRSWLAQSSAFSAEEVKPFMQFIEKTNALLEVAGRAIGHRVWQSIEYYMSNYPDVCVARKSGDKDALARAMHIAFEDQLVQKVMPKLRGIDTRGKSRTECLDRIASQLVLGIHDNPFNLDKDFELACELGYGQFIWQSANYLNDEPGHEPG